ncbi:MAG: hypothetical protein DRP96_09875 [Candidatus Neomarinimicrobiota bacterium]|nr:MAG: hypothetical protein DRP96_09875 [Candidatus Neomarinimicrobiota bacterium]
MVGPGTSEWTPVMKIKIDNPSLMMILLLEECNFSCVHCIREDEPMDAGYKLSYNQFKVCLSDCRRLESVSWVHFSGGEPTLWKEGNRSLIDLLLEISIKGFISGFTIKLLQRLLSGFRVQVHRILFKGHASLLSLPGGLFVPCPENPPTQSPGEYLPIVYVPADQNLGLRIKIPHQL